MSINPDAENLLMTARQSLMEELLPQLPKSLHYQARMIANAMIIAAREIKQGQACRYEEAAVIRALQQTPEHTAQDLSVAIRRGEFDEPGAKQEQLLAGLSKIVRNELSISKPKAVQS